MIDHEKLAAAYKALGMREKAAAVAPAPQEEEKSAAFKLPKLPGLLGKLGLGGRLALAGAGGAGLYTLAKRDAKRNQGSGSYDGGGGGFGPAAPDQPSPFSEAERRQFARHGLDPESLQFAQTVSRLRQGMNLQNKLMQQAMSGQLPANVLGGNEKEEPEDLEAYA